MTKLKSAAPSAKAGKPAKVSSGAMLAHLNKVAKAFRPAMKGTNIILLLLITIAALLFPLAMGVKGAMLYLIADNGKKSGRADGNVYMRNGRVRGFVVPSLVQNGYTTAVRALLSMLSQGWNALTDSDRASWLSIDWLFRSNRFGVPKLVKGKEAYVMLNTNLTNIGGTLITVAPPSSDGVPGITGLDPTADQSSNTVDVVFSPSPTDATVDHLVFATTALRAGISRPKASAFRLITTIAGGTASPVNIAADYNTKYGQGWQDAAYLGAKIWIKVVPINNTTGVSGGAIIGAATIVA